MTDLHHLQFLDGIVLSVQHCYFGHQRYAVERNRWPNGGFNRNVGLLYCGRTWQLTGSSGLMCVITLFLMLPTHIMLVIGGKTTLESFESGTQQRAEAAALKSEFPALCPVRDIRRVRRQWDEEFGGVQCNDRWAFGRRRDMWRQEMGDRFYGWICGWNSRHCKLMTVPVGRPLGDGLHFPANPRFGPHGEWLRMEEWPKVVTLPS